MKKFLSRIQGRSIGILFFFFLLLYHTGHSQIISSIAGSYSHYGDGYTSDSGVRYKFAFGVATDTAGNIYYTQGGADRQYQTLNKIDINGVVTILAGKRYEPGFSGEGKRATEALLNNPTGVYADKKGNIYVATKNRIRKISADAIITTIAGNDTAGYSGDGGLATEAELNGPDNIAVDAFGNIYISDKYNNRIRKINTTGIISTYAGNGTAGFKGDGGPATDASLDNPSGIVMDKQGNLFIADKNNNRIRKVNAKGIITTVAGNKTSLYFPTDVDVDSKGNVYFIEANGKLEYVDTLEIVHYVSSFTKPYSLALANDSIACVPTGSIDPCWFASPNIIKRNVLGGGSSILFGNTGRAYDDSTFATLSVVSLPTAVAFDKAGNLYFADIRHYRVRKVEKGLVRTVAGGQFGTGGYGDSGLATNARFYWIEGLAVNSKGELFISDQRDNRIRKVDLNGIITTVAKTTYPAGISFDKDDNLYIAEYGGNRIKRLDTKGKITIVAGIGGYGGYNGDSILATSAQLNGPADVSVDAAGNLFIADCYNHRIRKVNNKGIITTIAGLGKRGFSGDSGLAAHALLNAPVSVSCDPFGNLFILDRHNRRIRKIDTAGIITSIAGTGKHDFFYCDGETYVVGIFSGEGTPAVDATINPGDEEEPRLSGLRTDSKGNIVFADIENDRIREISFDCASPAPYTSVIERYINAYTNLQTGCSVICHINPTGDLSTCLNSIVTTKVFVEDSVLKNTSGKPFVARHYEIVPKTNSSKATASLTLMFTQQEFDDYNTVAGEEYFKLPSSPNDGIGIRKARIYTCTEVSYDTTSGTGDCIGTSATIVVGRENFKWNKKMKWWEVTFDVTGANNYFLGSLKTKTDAEFSEKRQELNNEIIVYPNPADDVVNIVLPPSLIKTELTVFDINGRKCLTQFATSLNAIINLKNLAPGIYIIHFENGEVRKIIKD